MTGYTYRRSRYYGRHTLRNQGLERALRHIREAEQLSEELGGADKEVKSFFFSLSDRAIREMLDEYESKYGTLARRYAEETLPKWRSGQVKMSGQTAGRLFALLPRRMPLSQKYQLVEDLWQHVGPRSKKRLRVGPDTTAGDAACAVQEHVDAVMVQYSIPERLEKRFNWLSSGDVQVKQQLLNYFRSRDRSLLVEGATMRLAAMLEHANSADGDNTSRLTQFVTLGNHELEIVMDTNSSGVRLEDPSLQARSDCRSEGNRDTGVWLGCAIWIGIALLIFLVVKLAAG